MNTVNEYLVVHVVHVVRSVWHWLLYDRLAMPVMVRRWPVPALCTSARARPPGKGGGAGRESESRPCSLLETVECTLRGVSAPFS